MANRVKLIREKSYITWQHVRASDNPADIGSRGEKASKLSEIWLKGPTWLSDESCWPEELITEPSTESEAEAKITREALAVAVGNDDHIENLVSKFNFWKTIITTAFIQRFIKNCEAKKTERLLGPLTTEETQKAIQIWVIKTEDQQRLNLQNNVDRIYECRGRIQGELPLYRHKPNSLQKWSRMPIYKPFMGELV